MASVKGHPKEYKVEGRVSIALDALDEKRKEVVKKVLMDRENFVASTIGPRRSRRISRKRPIYSLKGPDGLRIIYSKKNDKIIVMDLMQERTLRQFGPGSGIGSRIQGTSKPRRPRFKKKHI